MKSHDAISKPIFPNDTSSALCATLAILLASIGLALLAGCSLRQAVPSSVSTASTPESGENGVAAIIEGRVITLSEVHERMKDGFLEAFFQQPEARQFELHEAAIRDLVQKYIVEMEAEKQGKTSKELLDEITDAVSAPTLEEVDDWYAKNQSRLRGAKLEDVRSAITLLIEKERQRKALNDFLDPKLEALSWQLVLAPPRQGFEATRLVRGSANATVTIVTFSDYQCPYCVRAEPMLTEVLERYPDRVRLAHRHFPLDKVHAFARPAAEASMCAEEQGKFWEYHDGIFARHGKLGDDAFAKIAAEVGLDTDEFDRCVEERRYQDFVDADYAAGLGAGVTGTPSFFLNGITLKGIRDADALSLQVDRELARIEGEAGSTGSR